MLILGLLGVILLGVVGVIVYRVSEAGGVETDAEQLARQIEIIE